MEGTSETTNNSPGGDTAAEPSEVEPQESPLQRLGDASGGIDDMTTAFDQHAAAGNAKTEPVDPYEAQVPRGGLPYVGPNIDSQRRIVELTKRLRGEP